jgi:hypothetical protein
MDLSNNTLAAILWIGAGLILVIYMMRRGRRKRSR